MSEFTIALDGRWLTWKTPDGSEKKFWVVNHQWDHIKDQDWSIAYGMRKVTFYVLSEDLLEQPIKAADEREIEIFRMAKELAEKEGFVPLQELLDQHERLHGERLTEE